MDNEKIISLEERRPWYTRAWNKIKKVFASIKDWCEDHLELIAGAVAALAVGIWGYLFGWLDGRKDGYEIGHKDGNREGFNDGYHDCINDLSKSGYKVYGRYEDGNADMIVKKKEEEEI